MSYSSFLLNFMRMVLLWESLELRFLLCFLIRRGFICKRFSSYQFDRKHLQDIGIGVG